MVGDRRLEVTTIWVYLSPWQNTSRHKRGKSSLSKSVKWANLSLIVLNVWNWYKCARHSTTVPIRKYGSVVKPGSQQSKPKNRLSANRTCAASIPTFQHGRTQVLDQGKRKSNFYNRYFLSKFFNYVLAT